MQLLIELSLFIEGPMLETLDYTIRIGSTPTILYFDLSNTVVPQLHVEDIKSSILKDIKSLIRSIKELSFRCTTTSSELRDYSA